MLTPILFAWIFNKITCNIYSILYTIIKEVNMNTLQKVKKHLRAGEVYRRADLMRWSKAVDRHLKQLVGKGILTKLSGGVYYCPKHTAFGNAPATEQKLITAFLKDNRFLLTSPNTYNSLGLGATQLYNETVVYNRKRHGRFELGGRVFDFRVKPYFPKKLTKEFLFVDLVNNLDKLAEDSNLVLVHLKNKVSSLNRNTLMKAVREYGNLQSKKFFSNIMADVKMPHVR